MNRLTGDHLEKLYSKYNYKKYIHPDPLEFLYKYKDNADREIVALIASSLAYGRVKQILKSVQTALDIIGPPLQYLNNPLYKMNLHFKDFKHRFTTGDELAQMLFCTGGVIKKHGSLQKCFAKGIKPQHNTVLCALEFFANELAEFSTTGYRSLIPDPQKGSACKRLNLMLRWMTRKDKVDPGGWTCINKSKLIIPLDTHMHSIAIEHGLTGRKNANMRTALEITNAFAQFSPNDPVKYDFALTRPAIGGH